MFSRKRLHRLSDILESSSGLKLRVKIFIKMLQTKNIKGRCAQYLNLCENFFFSKDNSAFHPFEIGKRLPAFARS